ncbi:MAG: CPBP family intramembrane metalloprotease [Spirochaetia bacterium]|nr:CPBP family intramembrane metalloprotease [Spirochaetia bacterium]
MIAYLIQIILYRFIQLLLFKFMISERFELNVITIDNKRTFFQLIQLAAVFIIQLSIFVLLLKKKVYLKKYFKWIFSYRQTLNPFLGILVVSIPLILYAIYVNLFSGIYNEYFDKIFLYFVLFFFAIALSEELIFRGYFYKLMIKKNKKITIYMILLQALLFTMMHFNNPGHTYTRIGVVFLAGVLLGVVALRGFIYAVIFHFLWNFIQAYLLGTNVSGYRFSGSIFTYPNAPAWENNLYAGLFLCITILLFLILFFKNKKQFT